MSKPVSWLHGWLDICKLSLLLALLLPLAAGLLYPLFLLWPEVINGFWTHRPAFLAQLLPYGVAAVSGHLLASWHSFARLQTLKYPLVGLKIGPHLLFVALGAILAGGLFQAVLALGPNPAALAYGLGLFLAGLVLLRKEDALRAALPWLLVWALLQALGLRLLFIHALLTQGIGLLLLSQGLLPLVIRRVKPVAELPVPGRSWRRLALTALGGLLLQTICLVWLRHDLLQQTHALARLNLSQREQLLLERPVLRGAPVDGNGFEGYWRLVGNGCNLQGRQLEFNLPNEDMHRVRTMFDLETGVMVPDPELLERYTPQLEQLKRAAQHGFMQYPFPRYLQSCKEELPLPNIGTMQDLLLLLVARGIGECNLGFCAQGARHMLDAARITQDLSVYGQIVPMMVAYKVERILISSMGTRLQPQELPARDWEALLGEWQSLLAAEEGLFAPVLSQEILLAQQSLLEMVPDSLAGLPEEPLNLPIQQIIMPYVRQGLPGLKALDTASREYLAQPVHDDERWQALILAQKGLAKRNPFANNVLIDIVLAIQRYREHQVLMRGFYQHLALQAHYARHGRYPERLAQLVPALLPALPQDPYTGQPFVYRPTPEGFLLYSQGENRRDDGGDGFYGHFVHSASCSGEELVFAPMAQERCR